METYWNDPSEFFSTHCVLVANRSFSPHLLKSPLYFCFRPSCSLFSREMYVGQSRRDRINITIHFDILSYCYYYVCIRFDRIANARWRCGYLQLDSKLEAGMHVLFGNISAWSSFPFFSTRLFVYIRPANLHFLSIRMHQFCI